MLSQRVYHLPNLEGGIDYLAEDGRQITKEEIDATNLGKDFRYVSVPRDAERIEKHFADLLGDVVETDEQLQAIPAEAKKKTNEYLGIETPEVKAQQLLSSKVKQHAQPVQGTAGISNASFEQGLKQRLTPWAGRKRNDGLYDDRQWWVGRDVKGFNQAHDAIVRDIDNARGSVVDKQMEINRLVNEYGYGKKQAKAEFDSIAKSKLKNPNLAAKYLGVPNASADEGINTYLMQSSGLDAEAWNRGDPIYATDHMIHTSGGTLGVDSQRRMGNNMSIGILTGLTDLEAIKRELQRSMMLNDGTLRQKIKEIQGGREDKLLQTLTKNSSDWYRSNHDSIKKDLLMSSDMRSWKQHPNEEDTFAHRHGPYNPTIADGYEMYDLRALREDIMDRPMGDLKNMDIGFIGNKGALKMQVSVPRMQRYANTSMLDKGIISMARRLKR